MSKRSLLAASAVLATVLTQALVASAASHQKDAPVVDALTQTTRSTQWELVDEIEFQFNIEHPQGMIKLGDRYFITSVEIIEPTVRCPQTCDGYDRTPGKGVGHLYVVDQTGGLIADIEIGAGHMYHPGGLDFDGESLWVPVAEYRPNSKSVVYRIDPNTFKVDEEFRVDDHVGGVVRDRVDGHIHGVSWGSRTLYEWTATGRQLERDMNPSHFIDYQDCDYLAFRKMVCGGVAGLAGPNDSSLELGGLALIDLGDGRTLHEVPVLAYSPTTGHAATRNPVFVESTPGNGLRLYTAPDDGEDGAIQVYEAQ